MAVEEHSEEDKARLAMSTPVPNGRIPIKKSHKANSSRKENDKVKESNGAEDDELTSLAWLQDTNLLKNFQVGPYAIEGDDGLSDSPSSDYLDETVEHVTINGDEGDQNSNGASAHTPYNPTIHSDCKPPFSFSCLIFMAIEDSINKALPVKEIYNWILTHFPYFQTAPTGWKNSVRHNLSLSKCFRKVEKEKGQNVGKGSLWCIDPEFRPNLIQALQKTPHMANVEFSHLSCMSPSYQNGTHENEIKPCLLVSSQQTLQIPSPELFPYLSRRLASSMKDPEVDAAATMLTLKNGPSVQNISEESESDSIQSNHRFRKRIRLKPTITGGIKRGKIVKSPVITTSPSEDHTYSACVNQSANSADGPSDEEGKKSIETKPFKMNLASKTATVTRKNDEEEGAHALLNLAEIASKRLMRKTYSKLS